jgi:hypothetical protein
LVYVYSDYIFDSEAVCAPLTSRDSDILRDTLANAAPGTVFVIIESPMHGSSKIYGFLPSTTIGEIVHTFTETNPVSDIQEYVFPPLYFAFAFFWCFRSV